MKKKTSLKDEINKINAYSLVQYMRILGYTPTFVSEEFACFPSPFPDSYNETMVINVKTNWFFITADARSGRVMDLARQLFQVSPEEILADIVPYRIDQLLSATCPLGADQPGPVL